MSPVPAKNAFSITIDPFRVFSTMMNVLSSTISTSSSILTNSLIALLGGDKTAANTLPGCVIGFIRTTNKFVDTAATVISHCHIELSGNAVQAGTGIQRISNMLSTNVIYKVQKTVSACTGDLVLCVDNVSDLIYRLLWIA